MSQDDSWKRLRIFEGAISQQSAERAKIIATGTNRKKPEMPELKPSTSNEEDNEPGIDHVSSVHDIEYEVGDYCRVTYDVDGIDYEAEIVAIDFKTKTCVVRFIGYGNEQSVKLTDLIETWGAEEQEKQRIAAAKAQYDDEDDIEDADDDPKSKVLFQKQKQRSVCSANLPVPPMPPIPPMLADSLQHESEEFSAMLMAWYMSGYYTGFYQGRRFARQAQQKAAAKQNKAKNSK